MEGASLLGSMLAGKRAGEKTIRADKDFYVASSFF